MQLMDWFEEWFDSPLYEKLYADRDEQEAARLVELLTKTLNINRCSRILDLGCGRGRHSINLARKGYQVTGVDLSPQAIETARAKAEKEGLQNIRFKVGDMRKPLPDTFDAVVNLFTTFGYFSDDAENTRVFDSVAQMLAPGGMFVLDYLNAPKVRSSYKTADSGAFQGIHYDIKRYIKGDTIYKDIVFKGGPIHGKRFYSERVKLYELPWFKRELKKRELYIQQIYGDYEGNAYEPGESARLLLVCRFQQEVK